MYGVDWKLGQGIGGLGRPNGLTNGEGVLGQLYERIFTWYNVMNSRYVVDLCVRVVWAFESTQSESG